MIASDIDKAVELFKGTAPRATIILFGSRARGDARPDSDVDFLSLNRRSSHDARKWRGWRGFSGRFAFPPTFSSSLVFLRNLIRSEGYGLIERVRVEIALEKAELILRR
jgi:predicted nucleotidyltransferase